MNLSIFTFTQRFARKFFLYILNLFKRTDKKPVFDKNQCV